MIASLIKALVWIRCEVFCTCAADMESVNAFGWTHCVDCGRRVYVGEDDDAEYD